MSALETPDPVAPDAELTQRDAAAFARLAARTAAAESPDDDKGGDDAGDKSESGDDAETDDQAFDRLARLSARDYDRAREGAAKRMGIRVRTLDSEVQRRRTASESASGTAFTLDAPEPWPHTVDGARLLGDIAASVGRHVVLPPGAADAVALWVTHAHAHDAARVSPLLAITSPVPGCGKTTLLDWLGCVVPKPLPASNITTAALFRSVERWQPTLLVDEADTFLGSSDDLRGIINSGHAKSSAFVIRTVGEDHEPRVFSTWAPKAIAMIGKMHATLTSRSITIELKRKGAGERAEPLADSHRTALDIFRRMAARWSADSHDVLRYAKPAVPAGLANRAADNWTAMLAIADAAGGDWPDRARNAAVALSGEREDESHAAILLADLRTLFDATKADRLPTAEVVAALGAMDDRPWPEWRDGRPLTARQLARLLEPFHVRPRVIRPPGGALFRGYHRADLADAFARYTSQSVTALQASTGAGLRDSASVTSAGRVTDWKTPKASTGAACNAVTDKEPEARAPRHCTAAEYRALRGAE